MRRRLFTSLAAATAVAASVLITSAGRGISRRARAAGGGQHLERRCHDQSESAADAVQVDDTEV